MLTLDDLNAEKACDAAFEFEYIQPDGSGSGFFVSVLGGQSKTVTDAVNKLVNERRRREAANQARARKNQEFIPVEDDIEFARRLTAVRVASWRGLKEPYSPENALLLCQKNQHFADQVAEASSSLENFMKGSLTSSSTTPERSSS